MTFKPLYAFAIVIVNVLAVVITVRLPTSPVSHPYADVLTV